VWAVYEYPAANILQNRIHEADRRLPARGSSTRRPRPSRRARRPVQPVKRRRTGIVEALGKVPTAKGKKGDIAITAKPENTPEVAKTAKA
jgi:hypothetical protein